VLVSFAGCALPADEYLSAPSKGLWCSKICAFVLVLHRLCDTWWSGGGQCIKVGAIRKVSSVLQSVRFCWVLHRLCVTWWSGSYRCFILFVPSDRVLYRLCGSKRVPGVWQVVRYLLERGAPVEARDKEEQSALIYSCIVIIIIIIIWCLAGCASSSGVWQVVRYLVERDNVGGDDAAGRDVVTALMEAGADPTIKDTKGKGPMDIDDGHDDGVDVNDNDHIVDDDDDHYHGHDDDDVMMMMMSGRDVVTALMEAGADPTIKDTKGKGPMDIDDCLDDGVDVNDNDHIVDYDDDHHHGHDDDVMSGRDVVTALMEAGADPTIKDTKGKGPMDIARETHFVNGVKELQVTIIIIIIIIMLIIIVIIIIIIIIHHHARHTGSKRLSDDPRLHLVRCRDSL
jgi:hypothetical protein